MRGFVPVLFAAHLINITVTRKVSALNPALRIPLTVVHKQRNDTTMFIWRKSITIGHYNI